MPAIAVLCADATYGAAIQGGARPADRTYDAAIGRLRVDPQLPGSTPFHVSSPVLHNDPVSGGKFIPAYLITAKLGLLNSYLGLALPLLSTIICIFVFKACFEAVLRSLVEAARIDGMGDLRILWQVMLPLSRAAIGTNVILAFTWSWNNFLWPLIIIRTVQMQTLPLGLANFLSYMENTTSALCAFVVMVLAPGIAVFLMAQKEFIRGLTSGAAKG
jgi:ABC-type glycerol-3-phosphate transport system permease component